MGLEGRVTAKCKEIHTIIVFINIEQCVERHLIWGIDRSIKEKETLAGDVYV